MATLCGLEDAGINDILVVEEVPAGEAAEGQPLANPPPVLGNERAPRFWQGSITDLPFYQVKLPAAAL